MPRTDNPRTPSGVCCRCPLRDGLAGAAYAYLLGQYLGDGWIGQTKRGVHRLTVSCAAAYPAVIDECTSAIAAVFPENRVGRRERSNVVDVGCYSTHVPCLFPQHGPGMKHQRPIVLEPWQAEIALERWPDRFVRGLVHSDGCRSLNRVTAPNGKVYVYPRYTFSNRSDDIRALFAAACDALEIEWRRMNRFNLSVARRAGVAVLDELVGPKR